MSGTITRADRFTQTLKTPDLFSDFLNDFSAHPITGDIARIKNDQSIKQALRNLVFTDLGERLYQPTVGSNVRRSLFEFNDSVTAADLQYHIKQTIENNEPRVSLLNVTVTSLPVQDKISINIVFAIINTGTVQSLDLLLKRVR